MEELTFPEPDRDRIVASIRKLAVHGRPLRSTRNLACVMCGRSVLPLGRLAWPGAPLCCNKRCEMTPLSHVTRIFITPYGRAITQGTLRIFCRTLEKDRVLVQRHPIIERAEMLTDGYLDLLKWQQTYHDYDRLTNPEDYALGRVALVPPRHLDDVLVFRATKMPAPVDPTQRLAHETSRLLHRVRKDGPSALAVPF